MIKPGDIVTFERRSWNPFSMKHTVMKHKMKRLYIVLSIGNGREYLLSTLGMTSGKTLRHDVNPNHSGDFLVRP